MNGSDMYRRIYRGFLYWLMRFALTMTLLVEVLPLPPVLWLAAALSPCADTEYQTGYLAVALTVCKNE